MSKIACTLGKLIIPALSIGIMLAPASRATEYFSLHGKMVYLEDREPDSIWAWDKDLQHVASGSISSPNLYSISIPCDDPLTPEKDGMKIGDTLYFNARIGIDPYHCYIIRLLPLDSSASWGYRDVVLMGPPGDTINQDFLGNLAIDVHDSPTSSSLPSGFGLSQNYPNPFNPVTNIEFDLPRATDVSVEVFNVLGQRVETLVNERLSAGRYVVTWDGRTASGAQAATGVYFYRIRTEDYVESRKMVLLR